MMLYARKLRNRRHSNQKVAPSIGPQKKKKKKGKRLSSTFSEIFLSIEKNAHLLTVVISF